MKKLLLIAMLAGAFAWPEWIGTKQDLVNLLAMPEHKERAIKELQRIYGTDDAKSVQVVSGSETTKDLVTKEIATPKPVYKRYGFASKDEVGALLSKEERGGRGGRGGEGSVVIILSDPRMIAQKGRG